MFQSAVLFLSHHWRLSKTFRKWRSVIAIESFSELGIGENLRQLVQSSLLTVLGREGKGQESEVAVQWSPHMPWSTDLFPPTLPFFLSPSFFHSYFSSFCLSFQPPFLLSPNFYLYFVNVTCVNNEHSKIAMGIVESTIHGDTLKWRQSCHPKGLYILFLKPLQGCPNFWCLWATLEEEVVLGHTLNTLRHVITKKSHNVSSKFTILCWATFTAILGCTWPIGCRLNTPD